MLKSFSSKVSIFLAVSFHTRFPLLTLDFWERIEAKTRERLKLMNKKVKVGKKCRNNILETFTSIDE